MLAGRGDKDMMTTTATPDLDSLRTQFLAAQLAGDRRGAIRVLLEDGYEQGVPVQQLHLGVVQAAQHRIGALWEQNEVTIAQEHVATAIAQLALSCLYPRVPREPRNGRRVLIACVEGEQHEMGPRILCDLLEISGFDVTYLGANVPTESLVDMVRRERPDLLALSASLSFHVPTLRRAIAEVRASSIGRELPIAVGGHAFTWSPGLEQQLDVQIFARDAVELVEVVRDYFKP